jgi:hypothetical protein
LAVAAKLRPDISFNSFASYSLWPLIPVTELIPSALATAAWAIPQVIVTSPTEAFVEPVEPQAKIVNSEEANMPPTSGEIEGPSAISTTTSLDLATLGSVPKEDANEVSLAHTYVHGGDLFTIVEVDEPLESSVVESDMPRFVPSFAALSSLAHVLSSTLRSLPSPFSRGNLCIKDMDVLTSSGPAETESYVFVPFST